MDPNANLEEQRRIVDYLNACDCANAEHNQRFCRHCQYELERLLETTVALDEWLTRGGALPAAWTQR